MKKSHLMLVVAISAFVSFAFAEIPTSDGTPTLEFHTIPIEGSPSLGHKVTPYRFYNKMIITVWERVSRILCKRRLITAEAFFPQTE